MNPTHRLVLVFFSLFFLQTTAEIRGQISHAKKIIRDLSAPEMHGRGYVKKGHKIAAEYLKNEFKKIGLQPLSGSYSQPFLLNVNTQPDTVKLSIDGTRLVPGIDFLIAPGSPSLSGTFEGIVLQKKDLLNPKLLRKKLENAFQKVLLLDLYNLEKFPSNEKRAILDAVHFLKYTSNHPAVATLVFSKEKLSWHASTIQSPKASFVLRKQLNLKQVQKIEIQSNSVFQRNTVAQNIMGCIKGHSRPDSLLVITAHYDHLGRMGSETYFPGANDNASGVALLLQIAKHFTQKKNQPRYTLVFLAFGGEELGLLGSDYFVNHPPIPLKNIKFLLNFDLAGTGEEGIQVVNADKYPSAFKLLCSLNQKNQSVKQIKARKSACNSDHCSFDRLQIPCFYTYTLGGIAAYHDVFDRFETLSLSAFEDYLDLMIRFLDKF